MISNVDPQYTVLHLFSGSGGGALGFKRAGFVSLGSIDLDRIACRDLERLTGERAIVADIAAMGPTDLAAAIGACPDVVFTSPPCKGYSGCLPEGTAKTAKYIAYNNLALHGVWLTLEAWAPKLPKYIILENEPASTIRGRHTVRQAPAALCDWRGWPIATHELHRDEDGGLTLYGPELDLEDTRPRSDIVIRAPDGTWHRPMTTRELACLQGFPDDFVFEGSDSSSKTQPGIREHIGNAVPPPAAEAIAREVMAALIASHDSGYRLSNGNIWVLPEMEWAA